VNELSAISIRPVLDVDDARQIEDVQRLTWQMGDLEILPGRFLHALKHNGACLLGAYDGDKVVGFVFGLLGTVENLKGRIDEVAAARLQMYSAIMGVLPEYQGKGLGYRLKLAQREFALRIGVRLVTWTYDPLESRNAYFNVGKLGVICHRYFRDFHGPLSGINFGLPTDRFYVEWWVTSNRVVGKLSSDRGPLNLDAYLNGGAKLVNEGKIRDDNLLEPPGEFNQSQNRILMAEIPADIQEIKKADADLALAWRKHSRHLFEHYFDHNYIITDFVRRLDDKGINHSYYVLIRGNA
jgi:predicted GNAT superfamily acetyltransferase